MRGPAMTMREIAEAEGITERQVSNTLTSAFRKIRRNRRLMVAACRLARDLDRMYTQRDQGGVVPAAPIWRGNA